MKVVSVCGTVVMLPFTGSVCDLISPPINTTLVAFSVVLYDTSVHIGRVEGPRLEALELASSP